MRLPLLTATALLVLSHGPAFAAGNAAKGEIVFKRCVMCHVVEKGKKSIIGPNLAGVVGRKAGTAEFAYSPAMKSSGIVWTADKLDAFIKAPSATVKGTRMAFGGIPNAQDRADLIAFLATKK